MRKSSLFTVFTLIVITFCHGAVIRVPGDQPTIQAGLNSAVQGDTILVTAGVYEEWLTWPQLELLTLQGENPVDRAIVNPPSEHRCLTYTPDAAGSEMFIKNIRFSDSHPYDSGGALSIARSNVHLDNCLISESGCTRGGGGVYFKQCIVEIANSTISDCHSVEEGGGGFFDSCVLNLSDTIIERNDTGGGSYFTSNGLGLYLSNCSGKIEHCIIRDHSDWYFEGAGIYSTGGVDIIGCVFQRNEQWGSDYFSGALHTGSCLIKDSIFIDNLGVWAAINAGVNTVITNCLFIGNRASFPDCAAVLVSDRTTVSFCTFVDGLQAAILVGDGQPIINHCIFNGNEQAIVDSDGNAVANCDYNVFFNNGIDYSGEEPGAHDLFDTDPVFVTGPDGNFYLSQLTAGQQITSPCVDAGDPMMSIPYGTTRTDEIADVAPPDIGFHYPLIATPTPTPIPWMGTQVIMSSDRFKAGDQFKLDVSCMGNPGDQSAEMFVVLDVFGDFWFWPLWTPYLQGLLIELQPDRPVTNTILDFQWFDGDFGEVTDLKFWAAICRPGTYQVIGEIGWAEFGYY